MPKPAAPENQAPNKPRGFAAMVPEEQKRIASLGGKTAHERGLANEFTSESAREAGRKGGQSVSRDREHMRHIGARGGRARAQRWSSRHHSTETREPEEYGHGSTT